MAVFVVPIDKDFEQSADDALTLTFESEAAMEPDLTY